VNERDSCPPSAAPTSKVSVDTFTKHQAQNILNFKSLAFELLTDNQNNDTVKQVSSNELPYADLRKKMDDPSMQISKMYIDSMI